MFPEKYNSNKDIEIYSNNSYNVGSDEEYYDEKCKDLFLGTTEKIWCIFWKVKKEYQKLF